MKRLENKVALVTGAASGLGAAIAHKFALEGARVVVCGPPSENLASVVKSIKARGGCAVAFGGDICEEYAARECVQCAVDHFGKLDVLINHAEIAPQNAAIDQNSTEFFGQSVLQLQSTFLMCKFAVPELQKTAGNIIATGSEAGMTGMAHNTLWGAANGWIHAFIKGLAVEQAKYGIRANCVCPGPLETAEKSSLEAVANVFAFLASDMASFVTGAIWTANGSTIGN